MALAAQPNAESQPAAPTQAMARRRRLAALLRHTRQPEPTAQSSAASPTIIEEVKPVPSLLSRCSGPEDLTASAHLKTLEDEDVAFFKENG